MDANKDVLFEEMQGVGGNLGIIILNRPNVLNSLNLNMIHAMTPQLQQWAEAKHIKAVIIRAAEGRAFCAGGDLRLTYERMRAHEANATDFFRYEYQLNRLIFHFPKPYIALLNGITMGGGVGISIHGSHRVASERLLFAMPETGIGFFPDVGGTYFLPRLSGHLGYYLGLTGARLASDDCAALGIVQHKIAHDNFPELISALAKQAFGGDARAAVTQIIASFSVPVAASQFIAQEAAIESCFSEHTVEEIMQALQHSKSDICQEALTMLAKKSPSSLKISLRALQEGKQLQFDACMQQEYRLSYRFLQSHDFAEGIRAIIIDKDHSPKWLPNSLEKVTATDVEKYFAPLTEELV